MHQQTNLQVTYAKEASITYLFERNKNKNTKCSLLLFNRMIICYISIASSFDQKLQTNVPQFILHKEAQQTKQSPKKLNEKKKLNSLNSEINMKSFWHQQCFSSTCNTYVLSHCFSLWIINWSLVLQHQPLQDVLPNNTA